MIVTMCMDLTSHDEQSKKKKVKIKALTKPLHKTLIKGFSPKIISIL